MNISVWSSNCYSVDVLFDPLSHVRRNVLSQLKASKFASKWLLAVLIVTSSQSVHGLYWCLMEFVQESLWPFYCRDLLYVIIYSAYECGIIFVSVGASWKTRWYSMYNTYLYVFFSILWLVYLTSCLFSSWTKSPCTKRRALPTAHCILYTYNSTLAFSARADPRSNPEKVTSDIDPFGACPMPSSGCTWTLSLHNKQRMKSHRAQPWLHA